MTQGRGVSSNQHKIDKMICHSHKPKESVDKYHPLEKIEIIIVDKWFEMDNKHLYTELLAYTEKGHCPMITVDHGKMEEWFGETH